jgi:hypothetical protein
MRRDTRRQVALRKGRNRRQHQAGAAHGLSDVRRRPRDRNVPRTGEIAHPDRSGFEDRAEGIGIPAPESHLMAGGGQVRRRRIGTIPAAENSNFHDSSQCEVCI